MSHQNALDQASQKMDMSSIAALSFLVWDILITLDQEVVAVWSRANSSYSKWLFFFVRYFAVAMQISLLFVGSELSIAFHYTESDCVKWYIFQEVGTQLLVAAVESILIVRGMPSIFLSSIPTVYSFPSSTCPLRSQSQRHRATCRSFPPGEPRHDGHPYIRRPQCTFRCHLHRGRSPPSLIIFAAAFVSFESVLFILTLLKFLVALRSGWGRTPVVFLLVRDGTWAFILIFVTLCINAGFYVGEGNTAISAIAFPWLLSIESFAGARIVLNLHAISSDLSTNAFDTTVDGHYPHTSYSRPIRWRKATARIPPA
ncbi:hypothetical protein BGY98DRAFT_608682 [Russula aff. rugulosa BPL654]|nr:hypothetical protein BGY98DRAFT_608682 [Russula aff. rugulosa BPL654]